MFIIDHSTDTDKLFPKRKGRGLKPRDIIAFPPTMFAPPSEIEDVPPSDYEARYQEEEEQKSSLWHRIQTGNKGAKIPGLDQGQVGYCWAHSVTHTAMIERAMMNQPYVALSAYSVAAIIKKGQDEGGWCGLAAQFARENGIAPQSKWPQGKRDYRTLDTPATRKEMAKYKITNDYVDLTRPVYGQNMTQRQVFSCLFGKKPCAVDFNWWGHSVCAVRVVRIEAGSFGLLIWNSWGPSWGEQGFGVLRGSHAVPDGAVCTRQMTVSAA